MKRKTHAHSSALLMAIMAGYALAASTAHAETLLSSDFEGSLGAWTASSGASLYTFTSGTNNAPVGNGAANLPKFGGTITLTDVLPLGLRGYTSVTIAFRNTWLNGTTTRFLNVQYAADGVNFVDLAKVTSGNGATNAASSVTLNVGPASVNSVTVVNMTEETTYSGAPLTDTAKFRFVNNANASADVRAFVDEIVITATPDFGGVYWDIDSATAGSGGATPSGIWDATANWNPAADGTGTTAPWVSGGKAVFSAGSDATGAYTVAVSGTQEISTLVFKNGTPTLTGGTALGMTAATRAYTSPGVSATIATPLSDVGGPWLLTKQGSGTLTLSGDNSSATGGMLLSAGRIQFESAASINGTAKNVTVNAGSTVLFGASFGAGNLPAGLDRIVGTSAGVIAADNHDATNLDFSTPALTAAYLGAVGSVNYTGTLTPQGTTYRLGGGGGALTMANANAVTGTNALVVQGNVTLAGNNDYTGATTINGGSTLVLAGSTGSSAVTLNAATLVLGNANSLGSGTFTIANTGTVQAQGTVVTTNPVAANQNFTISGTGALTLGNLTLNNNRLITNNNTTATSTLGAIGGATRTLTLSGNGSTTVAGIIGTTTGTLTKNGNGTLTLNGANTYTGLTTISGGKLLVNGDQTAATGNLSVSGGATLGGAGIIGGNTTIAANGKLEFDFSTAPAGHAELNFAAAKTLNFSGASVLTITSSGGASTGLYTLVTAPGGITGPVPATVNLPMDWTADPVVISGNDLVINITSTGSGSSSAYDTWKAVNAPTGNPDDDFDGDGVSNAVEFMLGGTAVIDDLDSLPTVNASGGNMTFIFERDQDSIDPGTTVAIEVSTDLANWNAGLSPYAVPDGATGVVNPGVTVEKNLPTGFDTVTLTLPQTPDAKKFARLRVVIAP